MHESVANMIAGRKRHAMYRMLMSFFAMQLFLFVIDSDCIAMYIENNDCHRQVYFDEKPAEEAQAVYNGQDCAKPVLRKDRFELSGSITLVVFQTSLYSPQMSSDDHIIPHGQTGNTPVDLFRSAVLLN